ncbi:hypothetical protein [Methylobacterium sp. Leaf399]|uniref:hypothetical protein n=1 Tax=Methylobacterium sp. Leaf399 TaxID=1736364 RepID=UPI00138EC9B0|nr:hypothetical protein [Methylobacterium sp. Leaf399]
MAAWFGCLAIVSASRAEATDYGINFSFLNVVAENVTLCSTSKNATIKDAAFLPKYDQPEIRTQVQAQLETMRKSGFSTVRTIVFFGPQAKVQKNWFDVVNGAAAGAAIANYATDVKRAGFKSLTIALGPQGTIHPACRRTAWGDCYDQSLLPTVVKFVEDSQRQIKVDETFKVNFDLFNEGCTPADFSPELKDVYANFTASLVKQARPDIPSTVSCPVNRFTKSVKSIDSVFSAGGKKPAFYDVHIYDRGKPFDAATLDSIAAEVKQRRAQLVVGELSFGSRQFTDMMVGEFSKAGVAPSSLVFWPLRGGASICQVDVAPPYALKDAMGKQDQPH